MLRSILQDMYNSGSEEDLSSEKELSRSSDDFGSERRGSSDFREGFFKKKKKTSVPRENPSPVYGSDDRFMSLFSSLTRSARDERKDFHSVMADGWASSSLSSTSSTTHEQGSNGCDDSGLEREKPSSKGLLCDEHPIPCFTCRKSSASDTKATLLYTTHIPLSRFRRSLKTRERGANDCDDGGLVREKPSATGKPVLKTTIKSSPDKRRASFPLSCVSSGKRSTSDSKEVMPSKHQDVFGLRYAQDSSDSEDSSLERNKPLFTVNRSEGSKKHQGKIFALSLLWRSSHGFNRRHQTVDERRIKNVGSVKVCFENEFKIGDGCYGTSVYVGLHKDGSEVAVKRILCSSSDNLLAQNEQDILQLINTKRGDHIVNYRSFSRDDTFAYLVLDLCEETLGQYVESHPAVSLKRLGPTIITEILNGLRVLHCGKPRILHRDLKPNNVLVDRSGHMRLADFGISRVLNDDETTVCTDPKGTLGWQAVESIEDDVKGIKKVIYKRKSDVQVAGMISFFVLTKGAHPFGVTYDRMRNIIDGNPVDLYKLEDGLARNFVSWLIRHNIKDRPYVEQALSHEFLRRRSPKP